MTIHLIHGIHTQGMSPVQGLVPFLPKPLKYPDYGYIYGAETRIVNPIIVGALLPYIEDGDILIGHSNGCAIAYELACKANKVLPRLVFINAALTRNIVRPAQVKAIDVYFNAGDEVTEAAEIGARFGFDDTDWGDMGHAGYAGTDTMITNIDCGAWQKMPVVNGHSDFFSPVNLPAWGLFLACRLGA